MSPPPRGRFARIADLRRRGVFRVAAGYLVAAWIAIEATSVLVPALLLPAWITRAVIVAAIAGFPFALVLAWVFDLTPDGVTRTREPEPDRAAEAPPASHASRRWRRPVAGMLVVLGVGALLLVSWVRGAREDDARALLPEIRRLADEGRFGEAYAMAAEVESWLEDDSTLAALWPEISDVLTVHTDPAGARVSATMFVAEGEADPALLGETPLDSVRIPRVPHHLRIELDGYADVERLASSELDRELAYGRRQAVEFTIGMVPAAEAPEGSVYVPGSTYTLVSPDLPGGLTAQLDDYFIDRFEVSNQQFREFVTGGGYDTPALWPTIIVDGDTLGHAAAMERFRDRTGIAAPRGWTSGNPPAGQEAHPVTDVTWYEAAAYCAWRGMRLPSAFQWEKAARDGRSTPYEGVVMPWGLAGSGVTNAGRVNVAGTGTGRVDEHPFGISPYGAYAMAGNVKEWMANVVAGGRAVTGASWEDPLYLFSEFGEHDPASSASTLGFRCAQVRAADARRTRDQGSFDISAGAGTPVYRPVDEATFRALLTHYRYDPVDLAPELVERVETAEWVREKVSFARHDGARVLAYLWLPRSTPAPHQTVLFVPGGDAFQGTPVWFIAERWMSGIVRSGRALLAVVLEGMEERPFASGVSRPDPGSVRFRDQMVRHATEIRLGLDYLESRDDIDPQGFAYAGISFGAGSRLAFAAVDDRYQAVVLIGGGIDERLKPNLPEADNVNFAPYIRPPVLLLNGRQDEEHPWLSRALPLWNLLSEPKELLLVDGAGHVPPAEIVIPAMNRFLDSIMGPVRR